MQTDQTYNPLPHQSRSFKVAVKDLPDEAFCDLVAAEMARRARNEPRACYAMTDMVTAKVRAAVMRWEGWR